MCAHNTNVSIEIGPRKIRFVSLDYEIIDVHFHSIRGRNTVEILLASSAIFSYSSSNLHTRQLFTVKINPFFSHCIKILQTFRCYRYFYIIYIWFLHFFFFFLCFVLTNLSTRIRIITRNRLVNRSLNRIRIEIIRTENDEYSCINFEAKVGWYIVRKSILIILITGSARMNRKIGGKIVLDRNLARN